MCRSLLVLLTNAPELHAYVTRQLYNALHEGWSTAELSLFIVAVWWLGEPPLCPCVSVCVCVCVCACVRRGGGGGVVVVGERAEGGQKAGLGVDAR